MKETEANTKNLFGRYGSQRMKDWQEILRLYETDNVYIAEAAQILTRNVNYEVPNIKKQIHKLEQTIIVSLHLKNMQCITMSLFYHRMYKIIFIGFGKKRSRT